jgi:hypothetical protein
MNRPWCEEIHIRDFLYTRIVRYNRKHSERMHIDRKGEK